MILDEEVVKFKPNMGQGCISLGYWKGGSLQHQPSLLLSPFWGWIGKVGGPGARRSGLRVAECQDLCCPQGLAENQKIDILHVLII